MSCPTASCSTREHNDGTDPATGRIVGFNSEKESSAEVVELFNIAKDPNEITNLAETQPDKVKELRARYEALAGQAVPPKVAPAVPGFRSPTVWGERD